MRADQALGAGRARRTACPQRKPREQCRRDRRAERERRQRVPNRDHRGADQPEISGKDGERHRGVIAVGRQGALIEMVLVRAPDGLAARDIEQSFQGWQASTSRRGPVDCTAGGMGGVAA